MKSCRSSGVSDERRSPPGTKLQRSHFVAVVSVSQDNSMGGRSLREFYSEPRSRWLRVSSSRSGARVFWSWGEVEKTFRRNFWGVKLCSLCGCSGEVCVWRPLRQRDKVGKVRRHVPSFLSWLFRIKAPKKEDAASSRIGPLLSQHIF